MRALILFLILTCFIPGVKAELVVEAIDIEVAGSEEEPTLDAPEPEGHHRPKEPETDLISFFNGNALGGDLISLDPGGVTWRHSDVEDPIRFSPANLKRISLVMEPEKQQELMGLPRIELTNGDAIRGKLVRLGPETFEIESPAVGTLKIQRDMIRRIDHKQGEGVLYQGPNEGDWSFKNHRGGSSDWQIIDGAMMCESGQMSASMEPKDLPERVSFSMEVEWRGSLNLNLGFWGIDDDNPNYNTYALSLQEHYARIQRNFQKHGHSTIAQQQLQPDISKGKASLTLYLDAAKKTMVLFLNGNMVGQWQDSVDFPIRGDLFTIYNQSNGPLKVSGIRIETWDGKLKTSTDARSDELDEILTVSGDSLTGTVERVEKQTLWFQSEFAELKVPLDRLQTIHFAPSTRKEPASSDLAVQLHSVNDDRITLDQAQLKDGVLTGSTGFAGELSFQAAYLKGFTLNPADDRHQERDWAWD